MLARSSARAGLISSTPAAARLGDTCKPVVNRLDSILATCASQRSAATHGKRGAVAIGLRLHSCGDSPAPCPKQQQLCEAKDVCARRAACGIHEASSRRPIAMAPASAIPAATLPAQSGSTPAPIASSLPRREPVVTTRTMPQPTRTDRWLAQVTTPSDGLPDPSSCRTAQYGPSTCPLPAGSVQSRAAKAHLRTLGQGLNSMAPLPTGSTIDADTACRGGKQYSKRHETGVVSRVPRTSRHA
jgi:hypothetical protein